MVQMIRALNARHLLECLSVITFAVVVVGYFHDRTWCPPDDGAYAHVAERILQGEVLHRDVQDVHPGYVNFVNALALKIFGGSLVSLRYPLAALAVIQAGLVFFLLRPKGLAVAVAGATALTALSFVQFLNPTAHWYCQFLLVATTCALAWISSESTWRLLAVGFLLGMIFLFRQLTGVIVAMAVVTYLLVEVPPAAKGKGLWLSRGLIGVMAAGLTFYLVAKADPVAAAAYGAWPLGILAWTWFHAAPATKQVIRILGGLTAGAIVAAAPLLIYHIANGSLLSWLDDTTIRAMALTEYEFFQTPRYWKLAVMGLRQLLCSGDPVQMINGLFWLTMPLLAPVLGLLSMRSLMRSEQPASYLLPILSGFYSIVSLHYQIPIYLFYSVGLTVAGLLWIAGAAGRLPRVATISLACSLSALGLYYHAGQSHSRGYPGILRGERLPITAGNEIDRLGLLIEPEEATRYAHFSALVKREVSPSETILALPGNSELYFLTGRRNPFRFFNSALGIHTTAELRQALQTLTREPPGLVFHRPDDKYNTAYSWQIIDFVQQHYDLLETTGGFNVYRLRRRAPIEETSP